MTEISRLHKRPEMAASLIREKTDLSQSLARRALRSQLLVDLWYENEAEAEAEAERIAAINDYLGEAPEGTPA